MSLSLSLFGAFELRRDGMLISDFRGQSVRALLAYLALEADRPHEREHLCALLWPDEPPQTALTNLRQTLHRLRQSLEPEGEEGRYLLITRQTVQLNGAELQTDVADFSATIAAVATHRHRAAAHCTICVERLGQALGLYRGELLPGFGLEHSAPFEEWLLVERERLRNQLFGLLDSLAAHHERRGDLVRSAELLRRWLALEPWHEEAHLRLIGALARAGQRAQALRQFERYRSILAADLGVEPSPAATQLVAQVRAGRLVACAQARVRHAPSPATPFFGRARELALLGAHLSDPACRLLTLTGMGGSGKTRLAIEAASRACYAFAEAAFVSLVGLAHAEQLPEALVGVLGLVVAPDRPLLDQLREGLHERELLLVLDNCEHVAELGPLVAGLLAAAPGLCILATSREPLNLRAEWVVPIAGLGLGEESLQPPEPTSYAAGQLFLQVARQMLPPAEHAEVAVTPDEARLIRECCALLEGGPLAIELAASQLRTSSLAEVVAQVRASCADLATTMADVPQRQRSLRAVFDWSWRLLSPLEQRTLARLAVCRGGFEQSAAEALGGAAATIERLVDKSLLWRDADGRYAMHEQIRQFAEEQLAALAELEAAGAAHAAHFLNMAAGHERAIDGSGRRRAIAALQREHDNLRRAWSHAVRRGEQHLLSAAGPTLGQLYASMNLHEAVALLSGALGRLEAHSPEASLARRRLLDAVSAHLLASGRAEEARAHAEELLALSGTAGDFLGEAQARLHLGEAAMRRRDFRAAWASLEEAGRLCANNPSRHAMLVRAHSLLKRGSLLDWQQLPVERSYAEEAYALFSALDTPRFAGLALNRLANQHRRCGDYGRSLAARREAVALLEELGELDLSSGVLNDLGEIYLLLGCYAQARVAFERGLAGARRIGAQPSEIVLSEGLGRALFHLGDLRLATHYLERALAMDEADGGHAQRGYFFTTLGYIAEGAGDLGRAAAHYATALNWWEASGHSSDAHVEPLAGLARVELARRRLRPALAHVEAILPYLAEDQLQDALEPMWVHQSCAAVLEAAGDGRATGVATRARRLLLAQAAQLSDPDLRDTFLNAVAAHRAILGRGQALERSVAA